MFHIKYLKLIENKRFFLNNTNLHIKKERYVTPLGNCDRSKHLSVTWYDNIRENRFNSIGAQKDSSDFIHHECTLRH